MRSTIGEAIGLNGGSDEIDMLQRIIDAQNKKMMGLVNQSVKNGVGIEDYYDNTDLDETVGKVIETHTPVCVSTDGLSVIDDIGGIQGYADFLENVFVNPQKNKAEDSDTEMESSYLLMWAEEGGCKTKAVSPHKML